MSMPGIHNCAQMVAENERLRKLLRKLKNENHEMQNELQTIKEQQKMASIIKEYCTTRNVEVQTETIKSHHHQPTGPRIPMPASKQQDLAQENEKMNRLLNQHNNLMKRYERELKANMENMEHITSLNQKNVELESQLRETENKRKKVSRLPGQIREDLDVPSMLEELLRVRKEKDRLAKDVTRLKKELGGLDHDFFEEIEDMKYALQQAAQLNQSYEKSLRAICRQFGLPFPNP